MFLAAARFLVLFAAMFLLVATTATTATTAGTAMAMILLDSSTSGFLETNSAWRKKTNLLSIKKNILCIH